MNQAAFGMTPPKDKGRAVSPAQPLHPAWQAFIEYCTRLGYGEIASLKIQDGVPVIAEEVTRKVKFTAS